MPRFFPDNIVLVYTPTCAENMYKAYFHKSYVSLLETFSSTKRKKFMVESIRIQTSLHPSPQDGLVFTN